MKIVKKILMITFILLLGLNEIYAGGGNRTGTGGAAQLLIPVGVRGMSMGNANIATAYGVEALFWNPAGVAKMNNSVGATFSHMNYIADIGVEYGAVSTNFEGFGNISLNIKSLSIGEILVTTTQDPDGTGETFSPQMLVAGLTYSKQLTDRIALGVTANYIAETLGDASANGVAFNVGVIYDNLASINGLSFGIVVKNLGPQMKYGGSGLLVQADVNDDNRGPQYYQVQAAAFELPSQFEIGFGYKPTINEQNSLLISGAFQNNNFSGDEYKIGAEYGYNNIFFLRGGYSMSPESQSADYIYGLTAGAGLRYDLEGGISVGVDYAFRDVEFFEANHVFGVTLGF